MNLRHYTLALALFVVLVLVAHASPRMSFVSDLISTSAPASPTTHTIQFTLANAIPASGKIILTFEPGAFTIPAGFDYTDVDVAVWNGSAYVDHDLAAVASGSEDGIAVSTGTSGSITITLSSSAGLAAGSKVQVRLGTNATYGATGSSSIVNPAGITSYRIEIDSFSDTDVPIDIATAMIAVVEQVTINAPIENTPPNRSNGLPSGLIAAGNTIIEITFNTDRTGVCRYSTVPNTPYENMTNTFSSVSGVFFYMVLSGFQDATTYTYYVRCRGVQGAINSDDYPISFSLDQTPISDTSIAQSGGTRGSGSFPNGVSTLYQAGVTISGLTSPGSTVVVLKDGVQQFTVQSGNAGNFQAVVSNLERGTYTFGVYSLDSKQRKSATYSATLSLSAGTNNVISGIVIPPTVGLEKDTVAVGEAVNLSGEGAPGGSVDVLVAPLSGTPKTYHATSTGQGSNWTLALAGSEFQAGTYSIKARTTLSAAQSDYGKPAFLGVGSKPQPNLSNRADINGDGKVNLIDFSIMLSFWGTANVSADLNSDGTINLADFSILLFNWTG